MPLSTTGNVLRTGILIGFGLLLCVGVLFMVRDGQDKTRLAVVKADEARAASDAREAEERQRTLLLLEVIKQNQTSVNTTVSLATALSSRDRRLDALSDEVTRLRDFLDARPATRPATRPSDE